MSNSTVRVLLSLSFVLGLTAATNGDDDSAILKHDDGTQESKRSITGAGHAVRFECPDNEKWYVSSIAVHGARYGTAKPPREKFTVMIGDGDLNKVVKVPRPYSLFERGAEQWVEVPIPPVEVPKDFQVAVFFNPTRTKGVYVGIDEGASESHSMTIVPEKLDEDQTDIQGNWMIRAKLTRKPRGKPRTLLSAQGQVDEQAEDDKAKDAKVLGGARSLTLMHDKGVMADHFNIRGALYTLEFETPKNIEAYVWQVQAYASQFGGEHDSEAVNGDVYILDAERQIISRTSFPYSVAAQQKGWISIRTLPTRVKGKFYVSIDAHGAKNKGLYMGYESGNSAKKASTDELSDDSIQSGEWSEKFKDKQWMIRAKVSNRPVVYGAQP